MNRTFFDFVNARGENVIGTWLNGIPWEAKDAIELRFSLLRNVAQLKRPQAGILSGSHCEGLIEIRVTEKGVQYRRLAFYGPGPRQVTLLVGAREKGGKFEPRNACAIAKRHIKSIESGDGTIHEHAFS